MLKILIVVFLLLLAYRIIKWRGAKNTRGFFGNDFGGLNARRKIFIDPVCGKEVTHAEAYLLRHNGQTYGFCSRECMRKLTCDANAGWKM